MTGSKILKVIQPNESPPYPIATRPPAQKIKIGSIQLNTSFSNQYYLPLATGMNQAYAKKHLRYSDYYEFTGTVFRFPKNRKEIDEISEKLSDNHLLLVSNYTWGEQHSLAFARGYKHYNPSGIVVFGGPQVPDSKKQFRRNKTIELTEEEQKRKRVSVTPDYHHLNPFIDICVHGEGERALRYILEQMAIDGLQDKRAIPSISYIDASGSFHYNDKLRRMNDQELAETASPFTTGTFDALMALHPELVFIVMYETDRGCPFTCTYCDWGGATEDRISRFPMKQIYQDIMWMGKRKIPYVFLCNANFGILERDIQIAEFFAEAKARYGFPEAISTQNSKNPKKHTIEALKVLQRAGVNKATVMSQQSLNPPTLKAVRRDNMNLNEYYKIQKELAAEGIFTMTDLIPGMPEETYDTLFDGIVTLITNGQHNRIQFNILSSLVNTEMANEEYREYYGFQTVKTPVINAHGSRNDMDTGIEESQEFVVATNTMPPEDWVKTYVLCWTVNLLYFSKLLQIPIIILNKVYGLDYRKIFELFDPEQFSQYGEFPILSEVNKFLTEVGYGIQKGGRGEFIYSKEWLDIYWMSDEYVLIKMRKEEKIGQFYEEARRLMLRIIESHQDNGPLNEAVELNKSLLKLPFQTSNLDLTFTYNIWEIYKAVLQGKDEDLRRGCYQYTIDRTTKDERGSNWWGSWEDWYRQMVWYCNRRGAYLYGNINPHQEIAGHH